MDRSETHNHLTANAVGGPVDPAWRIDTALLLIRLASGVAFVYHGCAILFGSFGGPGVAGFAAFTHLPTPIVYLVGLAQLAGGAAILTGVLTRLGAACVAIVMLGAIVLVHLQHGFDISKNGMEYALAQFLIASALMLTGAGRYSLATLARKS